MLHYGDEHPRHGHRNPCELAEEEILAALRGEPYSIPPDRWQAGFKANRIPRDKFPRSNDPQPRPPETSAAASERGA